MRQIDGNAWDDASFRLQSVMIGPVLAGVGAVGLLLGRAVVLGQVGYGFLLWNLFLAWVPLLVALWVRWGHEQGARTWVLLWPAGVWLLFLPNAPYILTDLVHLPDRGHPWFWHSLVVLLTFAWAGLLAGVESMRLMHGVVAARWGVVAGWVVMVGCGMLSGVGVYLGRVERWNSWDLLMRPGELLPQLVRGVMDPLSYPRALVLSALFAGVVVLTYVTLAGRVEGEKTSRGEA